MAFKKKVTKKKAEEKPEPEEFEDEEPETNEETTSEESGPWQLAEVPTQYGVVIRNSETGEEFSQLQALVELLNRTE